jgi:hypothetical protein
MPIFKVRRYCCNSHRKVELSCSRAYWYETILVSTCVSPFVDGCGDLSSRVRRSSSSSSIVYMPFVSVTMLKGLVEVMTEFGREDYPTESLSVSAESLPHLGLGLHSLPFFLLAEVTHLITTECNTIHHDFIHPLSSRFHRKPSLQISSNIEG